MDISSLISGAIGNQIAENAADKLGIKNAQAKAVIAMAVPFLLKSLQKKGGAGSGLMGLLGDDDGGIMDNLGGFLSGGDFSKGNDMLGSLLGGKRSSVESSIAESVGIGQKEVGGVMDMLTPVLMGAMGKEKKEQGLDEGGLGSLLGGMLSGAEKEESTPDLGIVEKLLDQDGDGDAKDDLLKMGSKLLGGFLKR